MKPLFVFICIIHIAVWMIVLLSFLNKTLAYFNLYYFIPFIYLMHILPFHILSSIEKNIYPDSYEEKFNIIKKYSIVGELYEKINKKLLYTYIYIIMSNIKKNIETIETIDIIEKINQLEAFKGQSQSSMITLSIPPKYCI